MKKIILVALLVLCLPLVCHANTANVSGNFVNVTFDGSNDFDLCAFLGTTNVTLYAISLAPAAAGDTLTVRKDSNSGVRIFGPFTSVDGGGIIRYYAPARNVYPVVKGSEATANTRATFEVEFVK